MDHSCIDRPERVCAACEQYTEQSEQVHLDMRTDALNVLRGMRNGLIAVTPFWVALLWWLSR